MNINEFMSTISAANGVARQNRYRVLFPTLLLKQYSSQIYRKQLAQGVPDATDWMSDFYEVDMNQTHIELMAFCNQTQLPGYQFATLENRHYGPSFKIPHLPQYQEITMTFICGGQMWERYFFDAWMYMIMDPMTNDFNYVGDYSVDIDIIQYPDSASSKSFNVGLAGTQLANQILGTIFNNGRFKGIIPPATGRLIREKGIVYNVDLNYWTTMIDAYPISINAQELGHALNDSFQTVQVTFAYKCAVPFWGKASTVRTQARGNQETFRMTVTGP